MNCGRSLASGRSPLFQGVFEQLERAPLTRGAVWRGFGERTIRIAACNAPSPQASAPPAPGSVAVTPLGFRLPEGADCTAKIARYRAVQDNDLSMGHVNQSVYKRIKREIAARKAPARLVATPRRKR
jgi:hypothetical protein